MDAAARGLGAAVVGVAVGAGLALLAASRVWSTETVQRPPPLSPQVLAHTGGSLVPALPALSLVALAGAGALLATRGPIRRGVGVLVLACGAVVSGLSSATLARGEVAGGWVALAAVGGLVAAAAGMVTTMRGDRWPALGSRYERPARRRSGRPAAIDDSNGSRDIWDALDRGEDPTKP